MKKKVITIILLASTVSTMVIAPIETKASTIVNDNYNNIQISDQTNILSEIENNYLYQNEDGTFYISDEAYLKFDKEIIEQVKSGMDDINEYIKEDALKFELQRKTKETIVVNTYEDTSKMVGIESRKLANYGPVLSSYTYCGNYTWYWWGYKTTVNPIGCDIMIGKLKTDMAVVGGATVAWIGLAPAAAAVIGSLGFIGSVRYYDLINEYETGIKTKKGTRTTGWGKPSSGNLIAAYALY